MSGLPPLRCAGCARTPAECGCYYSFLAEGQSADNYVRHNEGTLDWSTGRFLCDVCYVKYGMPSGPRGWRATDANVRDLFGLPAL